MDKAGREAFGKYMRGLREAKGISRKAASAQIPTSFNYLGQLEQGLRNPPSLRIL